MREAPSLLTSLISHLFPPSPDTPCSPGSFYSEPPASCLPEPGLQLSAACGRGISGTEVLVSLRADTGQMSGCSLCPVLPGRWSPAPSQVYPTCTL